MDREIDAVKDTILVHGLDDWVHIGEAVAAARQAKYGDAFRDGFPDDPAMDIAKLGRRRNEWMARNDRDALPLGIVAVKELLRDGLIRIGQTSSGSFVAWSGTVEEIESRIDSAVESAEFPLLPGHLFWVDNTPPGDEVAESIRSDPGRSRRRSG
jgi:hypothetical protein